MRQDQHTMPAVALVVLLAVAMLACSSVGNLPNPFASPTPTATLTPTPTATPTSTPTSTPTVTPLPAGTVIEDLPGGGSRFVDYDGGYSIDIPARWSAVQLEQEDWQDVLTQTGANDPDIQNLIELAKQAPPGTYRLIAFDQTPADNFMVNFNVVMMRSSLFASMPLDAMVSVALDQMKAQLPSLKIKQLETGRNAHGLEMGAAEILLTMQRPGSGTVKVLERQHYFQTDSGLVIITFSAPSSHASGLLPAFDEVLDGIQIMAK